MRYVSRQQTEHLRSLLRAFPTVLLVRPRQCGKSTIAHHALSSWTYLDLERPADYSILTTDLDIASGQIELF